MAENMKFIRKNGRVIPVNVKKGSGSKGGKFSTSKPRKEKKLESNVKKGAALFFGGQLTGLLGAKVFESGKQDARSLVKIGKSIKNKSGRTLIGKAPDMTKAKSLFKSQMLKHRVGKAGAIIGIASTIMGAVMIRNNAKDLRSSHGKRAAKARSLNKQENRGSSV